jgi:heme-degrading monooxygenase HmoA
MVQARIRSGTLRDMQAFYRNRVIPALQGTHGCRYAGLMLSVHHPDECLSLTLWDTPADSDAYEKSGVFAQLLDELRPFLVESSEPKIQLSQDLKLEYVAAPEEPVVSTFHVAAAGETERKGPEATENIWVRIVSLKLRPGRIEEFKKAYADEVIPALQRVRGCRYAYLTERSDRPNEVISVTSWNSRGDAESYEQGGLFAKLLESQQHLLSELYEWKKMRERRNKSEIATSEDVAVEHYDVLIGRSFR